MSADTSKQWIVARIRENDCIGCTKCIQACPVDAIIGTHKYMHTVLTHECIGCKLCVDPCPVDCIELDTVSKQPYQKGKARDRIKARKLRLAREEKETVEPLSKADMLATLQRVKVKPWKKNHECTETP